GVGGELDVDLVGLLDDMVVGDDVAARVDDKARAESTAFRAAQHAVAVIISWATLAAEEAIEEVLHVAWGLLAVVVALGAAAVAAVGGRLGELLRIDVDHGRTDLLDDLREAVGQSSGAGNNEGLCVGGIDRLLLFATHVAGENGPDKDADREGGEDGKGRGEAAAADTVKQRR